MPDEINGRLIFCGKTGPKSLAVFVSYLVSSAHWTHFPAMSHQQVGEAASPGTSSRFQAEIDPKAVRYNL